MKMLDASAATAMFSRPGHAELVEGIPLLGNILAMPTRALKCELLDDHIREAMDRSAREGKAVILEINGLLEIKGCRGDSRLGTGECDAMLSCMELQRTGNGAYCILDDKGARRRASAGASRTVALQGSSG